VNYSVRSAGGPPGPSPPADHLTDVNDEVGFFAGPRTRPSPPAGASTMQQRRKKVWVDRFQTYLSLPIATYFLLYQAAVWACVLIERHAFASLAGVLGQGIATGCVVFFNAAVVFIGVLFIYDAIHVTHRIVGPLVRFRQAVRAITAGEEVGRV